MAPPQKAREPSVERTSEYIEFVDKLAAYHEKRGTHFDAEPKVGPKHIDLLRLYKTVIERGGYDIVSDEKLAWRKLGQDFITGSSNYPAVAFQLKGVYYRYLAAYEISTYWGEEPPPKEILEDLTARGGSLRSRTLANFVPPGKKDLGTNDTDASGDDGTPSRERNASEDTPGSIGRATRGLRQQPPQRVIFQPDTAPSRQRNASATLHPPQQAQQHHHAIQAQQSISQGPRGASTSYSPANNTETSSLFTNYEPRPQMPLTLRPVITPGNNPTEFAKRQKLVNEHAVVKSKPPIKNKAVILPGSGFDGPNIYVRCLGALKSGIRAEQDYALHHLVKISMERGDKYRFEGFPGLAEALVEKLLEVSSLFYKVHWHISYIDDDGVNADNHLNGLEGTAEILQRIARLTKLDIDDNIQTSEYSDAMLQINEAALTLRNMVMLEENALYVSNLLPLRDFLIIALNLPNHDSLVELKHYVLDIAEQITKYLHLEEKDPLYTSLLAYVQSEDRGAILTALRAISRISMNLEDNNLLRGIPLMAIQKIMDWILLNDEDLISACLDFLYQYTAVVDNVEYLLSTVSLEPLVNQLVRLLLYGARTVRYEQSTPPDYRLPAPGLIAPLPGELLSQLLTMEEPERSSLWLRCLFEEDPLESITQIALWQAYQSCFAGTVHESGIPLLPAAEFIKNVSTTFADKAAAQVQPGAVQKFIIKGIRYRSVPVDIHGEEFWKCLWYSRSDENSALCGLFFMTPQSMYQHILTSHLSATQLADGRFDNSGDHWYTCGWGNCRRFHQQPTHKLAQIASHIKVHLPPRLTPLPEHSDVHVASAPSKKPSYIVSPPKQSLTYHLTVVDERQDAAGIPLTAVLVLRNLARKIPKTEAEELTLKSGGVSWVERLFKPVERRLFEVMVHNKSLSMYMTDLIIAIRDV